MLLIIGKLYDFTYQKIVKPLGIMVVEYISNISGHAGFVSSTIGSHRRPMIKPTYQVPGASSQKQPGHRLEQRALPREDVGILNLCQELYLGVSKKHVVVFGVPMIRIIFSFGGSIAWVSLYGSM